MRLLFITAGLWKHTGGPAYSIPKTIEGLSKIEGLIITLITLDGDVADDVRNLESLGVEVIYVKNFETKFIYFNPNYFLSLLKIIGKIDIVHIQGIWLFPFWIGFFLGKLYGCKVVISPRGSLNIHRRKKSRYKKLISYLFFERFMFKYCDLVHVTSSYEMEDINNLNIQTETVIIPNGYELSKIREYYYPYIVEKENICLYFGRLDPMKGLDILLDAWSLSYLEGWKLVICGPDERNYKSSLVEKCKKLNIVSSVIFLNPIYKHEEKFGLILQSKLFVLPSYAENFGNSVAEAMNIGVPVIVSNRTPWRDTILPNIGWIVEPTAEKLSAALIEAKQMDSDELHNVGVRAKQLISNLADWKIVSIQMYKQYEKLFN